MFGRNPRLPIDATLGLHVEEQQPSSKCISDLKDRLLQAYHLATEAAQKDREKQKEGYDIRIRGPAIKPGDRVLLKVVSFDGKHKLADRWEQDPYIVVSQPNTDIPVYNLRKENNEGRVRTLHRNLLLPIGYIWDVPTPAPRKLLKRPPIPAKRTTREKIKELEYPHTDDHTREISSEDESEHGYIVISQEEPVYSDSTITDEPLVQQTDERSNADDEDAHPSTDDEDESAESASQQITDDETVQENTLDMDRSQYTDGIENLNPVRRSTRERRQPAWLRSGEFDICKSSISTTADWEKKVSCILNLATNSPIFQTLQAESGQAILSILSTSNTQS
jgi:hypothetical protein